VIDKEVKDIMDRAYQDVKKLLKDNSKVVEDLKEALLKYETLDGDEVKLIVEGKTLDKPTVADLLANEQDQSKIKKEKVKSGKKTAAKLNPINKPMPNPEPG